MDPELATDLVQLLNRELKYTRARLEEVREENGLLREQLANQRNSSLEIDLECKNPSCIVGLCPAAEELKHKTTLLTELQEELMALREAQAENEDRIAGLQERVSSVKAKYKRCKSELQELQGAPDTIEDVEGAPAISEEPSKHWSAELLEQLKGLCRNAELPDLPPIRLGCESPFALPKKLREGCSRFLHSPRRTIWLTEDHQCGLVVSPAFKYMAGSGDMAAWKKAENFDVEHLLGFEHEFFYTAPGDGVYYEGTYKGVKVFELPTEDYLQLHPNVQAQVLRDSKQPKSEKGARPLSILANSYAKGETKAKCLVIQCTGLNRDLHAALASAQKEERPAAHKRKAHARSHPVAAPAKKQKRKH